MRRSSLFSLLVAFGLAAGCGGGGDTAQVPTIDAADLESVEPGPIELPDLQDVGFVEIDDPAVRDEIAANTVGVDPTEFNMTVYRSTLGPAVATVSIFAMWTSPEEMRSFMEGAVEDLGGGAITDVPELPGALAYRGTASINGEVGDRHQLTFVAGEHLHLVDLQAPLGTLTGAEVVTVAIEAQQQAS